MPSDTKQFKRGSLLFRWRRNALPALLLLLSLAVGAVIYANFRRDRSDLANQLLIENRLRMDSTLEHVKEYFDSVYSTLLFLSLDKDVRSLRTNSLTHYQALFDHHWAQHRLAEIYIIQRDFDGTRPPMLTIEPTLDTNRVERVHTLERERFEFQVQMAQIGRFASDPNLQALISQEIPLCVEGSDGGQALGVVYSVPIRAGSNLVGIVAGMIDSKRIQEILGQGQYRSAAFLLNAQGQFHSRPKLEEASIYPWLNSQMQDHGLTEYFARAPEVVTWADWTALWAPVDIVSGQEWWLLEFYNQTAQLNRIALPWLLRTWALIGCVVFTGLAAALAVRISFQRVEAERRYLEQRQRLEREIQEVSERERRRIGLCLHEDLCQRIVGIEAMSRALEKTLRSKQLDQTALASSIAEEIGEVLSQARQLAGELHPVALESLGLLASVNELAATTEKRTGLACRVQFEEIPELSQQPLATHLFRIVQEALSNAVRHAQASQVVMRLYREGERNAVLEIRDNGIGIAPAATGNPGMGLRMMRYRSSLIGGTLKVTPLREGGTRVRCVFAQSTGSTEA